MQIQRLRNMQRLVCLSWLLIETLDELNVDTIKMLKYKKDLTNFIEILNDDLADTTAIQKSTYFNDLTNKIDTVIRKNFKDE